LNYEPIGFWTQIKQILRSRKFWILLAALVGIASGYFTGGIDAWQSVQALIVALGVYSTGIAIEDFGKGKG
jgi:ribose/xylose/arabinose/galactoside ABC-type transport system permease subunit